jgi:hypothetical protein
MSRPTRKTDLVIAANEQFDKLWKLIDSMTDAQQNAQFSFEDRDKNVRDVLVHFTWTGTTSLGSYCVSASSSHYDWAMKKIKNHIKTKV